MGALCGRSKCFLDLLPGIESPRLQPKGLQVHVPGVVGTRRASWGMGLGSLPLLLVPLGAGSLSAFLLCLRLALLTLFLPLFLPCMFLRSFSVFLSSEIKSLFLPLLPFSSVVLMAVGSSPFLLSQSSFTFLDLLLSSSDFFEGSALA